MAVNHDVRGSSPLRDVYNMNKFTEIGFAGIFGGVTSIILQEFFDKKVNGIIAFVYILVMFIFMYILGSFMDWLEPKILRKNKN